MAYEKRGPFTNVPKGAPVPPGAVPTNASTFNHFDDALEDQDARITDLEETPPGGGVTDHGALTGLTDDDHTQYHTDARGDARYSLLSHDHDADYAPIVHNHDATYVNEADHTKAAHDALNIDAGTLDGQAASAFAAAADLQAHEAATADVHDASAISVADAGAFYNANHVEGVLQEIAPLLGGGGGPSDTLDGISNPGGDINFVAGANVTITPDDTANTITIAATAGSATGMTTSATVVALKTLTGVSNGEYRFALGYHAESDGGGGIFKRDTALASFDEGITVDHSSESGGWQRILPMGTRYVNVRWWGAKGDGTATGGQANQETYFKKAADYLIANNNRGGTVLVPAGVYNIHAKIDLTSDDNYHYVNFVGLGHLRSWNQGYPSHLVQATLVAKTSGITILEYCSPTAGGNKYGGPYLENICFKDGTGASGVPGTSATGLRMNLCNDWSVHNCSFIELKYGLVNYSHNLNKGRASGDSNFPIESGYERVTTGTDGDASWGHVWRSNFNDCQYGIFTPHSGGMVVDGECRFSIKEGGVGIAKYGGSQMRVLANKIDGETFGTSAQFEGAWSGSSVSYLVGDYVTYQEGGGYMTHYYKAKTNHTSAAGSPPSTNTTDWLQVSTTFIESESEKDQVYGNQYEDVTTFYRIRDNGGTASGNNQLIYGNTGYGADSEVFIDAGAGTTGNRGLNSLTGVTSELVGPDTSGWTKAL